MKTKFFIVTILACFSTGLKSSETCSSMGACLLKLYQAVEESIDFENYSFDNDLEVYVRFKLNKDLSIDSYEMYRSSGNSEYDQMVGKGIDKISSFDFLSGLNSKDRERMSMFELKIKDRRNVE